VVAFQPVHLRADVQVVLLEPHQAQGGYVHAAKGGFEVELYLVDGFGPLRAVHPVGSLPPSPLRELDDLGGGLRDQI